MTINRNTIMLLSGLCCVAPITKAADTCPELQSKDSAAQVEYLRGDRAKLADKCIVAAIKFLGMKPYAQLASATLIRYLDYPDPGYQHQGGIKGSIPYVYPAVDVLRSLGLAVVPELIAVVSDPNATEQVRQNSAFTIALIYGAAQPEAIAALVSAAHKQTDPIAAIHLMDQARMLASKCRTAARNDCENAVLK